MTVTVANFAAELGLSSARLLEQLAAAGLKKRTAEDPITEEDKQRLLGFLQAAHGDSAGGVKRITLNRTSTSEIKQSIGAGKSRTVQVEVRRKRTYVKREAVAEEQAPERMAEAVETPAATAEAPQSPPPAEESASKAASAAVPAAEAPAPAEREVPQAAGEPPAIEAEEPSVAAEAAQAEAVEPEARRTEQGSADATTVASSGRGAATESLGRRPLAARAPSTRPAPAPARPTPAAAAPGKPKKAGERGDDASRRGGRRNPRRDDAGGNDVDSLLRRRKSADRRGDKGRGQSGGAGEFSAAPVIREVAIPETITVGELANRMAIKASDVIKSMFKMGVMATINQVIDQDTAAIVVEEMGHRPKMVTITSPEALLEEGADTEAPILARRPPVVTVMGHVDHGKTSLLDRIRSTQVASGEAGGITQHIGAYHVETPKGVITFLDTPGHEAFTAMRARGAQATDIVILVVAADDGVMPQTIEAIHHAKAAGVPMVVAVNKIDKPGGDPERIRQELANQDVLPEEWGGDTQFVNVSAKTGLHIDDLLDAVLLQAELLDLEVQINGPAKGVVIESRLDRGRGAVATVLVRQGTLHSGDVLLAGAQYGRVRALVDDNGRNIATVTPGLPVEVLGLSDVPQAGDEVVVVADERKAREVALFRQGKYRDVRLAKSQKASLESLFEAAAEGEVQQLNLLIKADVQGSAEALSQTLERLSTAEIRVRVIHSGVGGITESDVNLAAASKAVIIGFNVRTEAQARRLLEQSGVDVRYHSVIYDAVDEVKAAMSGMLSPEIREKILGHAEVRETFRVPKVGTIAGCMVTDGIVRRNARVRVIRQEVVIHTGEMDSLRRFKDDAREVREGFECGIGIRNFNDVRVGDVIEAYETVEVARTV
ncbi:translation initiation factor IF-2 [Acidithiobacillus caldus]|jgi:translation initiation factor IF-2|uniref:Translation initiation factor IF-2 n=6 Tax=Acidithiobacillus caldus TaxID=33059 RepID=F9ZRU7_ACICS|nr:translation initiation factor IF-2 [Acidithiobacillus caldus]AEK59112.1 Translation initiation factor 2 [Acidithiobacillus caldus SM-1]AIA56156.1 Translation initiation factor 2 [Acidithiobacillus caldus ATCC 51756]AUW33504.1 translation initiation factor IF-2 [Acidithiobacillus caldus]MBU2730381.1 translation initiation factor IF-2 [Acidithiobacillus caldus]MBU2735519.1 translation initiation factor IF-2 [Acidithiobacillus caldus ATCC 51756]